MHLPIRVTFGNPLAFPLPRSHRPDPYKEEIMSRTSRFTAFAAVLVPLAVACRGNDRQVAERPSSTAAAATERAGATVEPATSTVVPSYADADREFHRGRYEEATGMFKTYTEHSPEDVWGHYMLGLSAWKSGDDTGALEAFDAALRVDPKHRKSLLNSARVLLETDKPQDALDRVQRALSIEPLSSDGLRLEGRAEYALGHTEKAIDAYRRALAIDEKDAWAMNNLGYIYIQQGRADSALPPLARAVELRNNVPVFQNNFGTALERAGYFVSAAAAYEAALAADSSYTKAAESLERVRANGAQSDTSSVDAEALSREFQAQIEQWRSTIPADTVPAVDSTPAAAADSASSATVPNAEPTPSDSGRSEGSDSNR
jgi:Tfp pilus assembly protein PilF